jgi:DNA-binding GntR family transcriptional regulator
VNQVSATSNGDVGHITKRLMSEDIYSTLRSRIVNGEIPQGQRLVVARLAEEFGTSDIPAREALKMLQRDGLVAISPNRGAQVVQIDAREIPAAYLLRGSLEGLATRLAGPQLMAQDYEILDDLIERMNVAAGQEQLEVYYETNREFHSAIFAACPYDIIKETLQRTWDSHRQFGIVYSLDSHAVEDSKSEHVQLVAALRGGKWKEAERLARNHKYAVGRRLLRALGEPIPDVLLDSE